jgi:hypothetical protein
MATRGQTHQKRAREVERKERRERKQAKKALRAAGEWPTPDDAGELLTADDADKAPADAEPETAEQGWIQ